MVTVKLKDGSERQVPKGTTLLQVVENISGKLAKEATIARFNGALTDLNQPLSEDGTLEVLKFEDADGQNV